MLFTDGAVWMEMIRSRNKTSDTYNESIAQAVFSKVMEDFFPAFLAFKQKMEAIRASRAAQQSFERL